MLLSELEEGLLPKYKKLYRETLTKLQGLFYEILQHKQNGTLLASDLYRYNRYFESLNWLEKKIYQLGGYENGLMEEKLVEMYKTNSRIIGSYLGNVPPLSDDVALEQVRAVWTRADGLMNFSSRIWKHKGQLTKMVEEAVINALTMGQTADDLAREL